MTRSDGSKGIIGRAASAARRLAAIATVCLLSGSALAEGLQGVQTEA